MPPAITDDSSGMASSDVISEPDREELQRAVNILDFLDGNQTLFFQTPSKNNNYLQSSSLQMQKTLKQEPKEEKQKDFTSKEQLSKLAGEYPKATAAWTCHRQPAWTAS